MRTPLDALTHYFGYSGFRGRQEEVIRRVLAGGHSLVIMPTGGGKSLCFQIPALLLAETQTPHGVRKPITLVLSPLVALMKDQVDSLVAKGVEATFINSSLGRMEREARHDKISRGEFALLYVTPERFRKEDFWACLAEREVVLLAVDEAHCISEWGHDFRPDYTRVGEIRTRLGNPTTLALTATATPEVQRDIVRQLNLPMEDVVIFHEGIERPNLELKVAEVWDDDEKLRWILETRTRIAGSGIVYFTLIRKLLEFSERLYAANVPHSIYHGELPRTRRKELQDAFMNDDQQMVLATNAFGMGIDKESIRFVLHADLPGSLEAYCQEMGRAGRDGLPAECLLLYDERDLATQMEFLQWSNPDAVFYERVYDFLQNDLEQVNAFGIEWLRERLHFKQKSDRRLETALGMLERWGAIAVTQDPWGLQVSGELPPTLRDPNRAQAKLKRDQQKLWAIVQYAKTQRNRKDFISHYFGLYTGADRIDDSQ